jgi:AraC-like DNA-binding protein
MSPGGVAAANVEREIGRGTIAVVHAVHHPPGPHRDPAEERFDHPTIVFTTVGRWRFESARGRATAGPGAVIVGNAGETYRAGHDGDGAADRSVAISIVGEQLAAFDKPAVVRTPELEWLRLALGAALAAPTDAARALDLDAAALGIAGEAAQGRPADDRPGRDRDGVQAALDYLVEHALDDRIDLGRLADAAALSPFHVHRLFRERVGMPPGRYLGRLRLEHAATLLLDTERSVTRVAFDSGFGSLGHFHASFRRAYGRSPGAYRRLGPID